MQMNAADLVDPTDPAAWQEADAQRARDGDDRLPVLLTEHRTVGERVRCPTNEIEAAVPCLQTEFGGDRPSE